MLVFPPVIPVKDLEFYNKDYNFKTIEKHKALYKGGECFHKIAKQFLAMREIEKLHPNEYQKRIDRTAYIPHAAVIDFLVSSIFKEEPTVEGPSEYWESLNADADGDGTDLAMLARHLLLDALLHGRSWLEVYFGEDYLPDNDTDVDKENKLDARLQVVPCELVDDWGDDFSRIHTACEERDLIWGPFTRKVERWNFLTDNAIARYEHVKDNNPTIPSDNNAKLVSLESHDLGICPLIKLKISHPGMWVMNRIDQLLVQMYNRESALQYSLDQGCYSLLVLNLNNTLINQVYASEVSALKLGVGEDAKFINPSTSIYDAAMKDLDRTRTELARAIHGLSLEAGAKTQAPRATGVATKIQQGPMDALLSSFAAPVKDTLLKAFTAIALVRGEDPSKVILHGMDEFSGVEEVSSPDGESEDTPASSKPGLKESEDA